MLGTEVPASRTASRTTEANFDCAFVENALVFVVPDIGRARAPLNPPFRFPVWDNDKLINILRIATPCRHRFLTTLAHTYISGKIVMAFPMEGVSGGL